MRASFRYYDGDPMQVSTAEGTVQAGIAICSYQIDTEPRRVAAERLRQAPGTGLVWLGTLSPSHFPRPFVAGGLEPGVGRTLIGEVKMEMAPKCCRRRGYEPEPLVVYMTRGSQHPWQVEV